MAALWYVLTPWGGARQWNTVSTLVAVADGLFRLLWFAGMVRIPESERTREHRKRTKLWAEMHATYECLRGSAISPYAVRARMLDAAQQGADWDQSAYAIRDTACQRIPPVRAFEQRKI